MFSVLTILAGLVQGRWLLILPDLGLVILVYVR